MTVPVDSLAAACYDRISGHLARNYPTRAGLNSL